jgi:AraC family L-rhamnose operon regulatory protein RhaS
MTIPRIPVYQEGNTAYSADTCSRVTEAAEHGEVTLKSFARGQYPGQPIPNDTLSGLRTVGYWSAVTEQHWGLDWHRNEGIEITFILSGKNRYETTTGSWELHVGDMAVCPPWQIHRIGNPNIGVGTLMWFLIDTKIRQSNQPPKLPSWIILSEKDKHKLIRHLLYNPSQVVHLSEKFILTWKKLYRILRDAGQECPASALAITINEILYDFLNIQGIDNNFVSSKELPRSVEMVQTFFQELASLPGQLEHPWTLREMSRLCRISPTRFSLCCRQLTNLSPLNVLNQLRVRQAEEMIRNEPQKSMTEIAMQCGFTTSQYFATVFKKWTGKTPTEYKNLFLVQENILPTNNNPNNNNENF